MSLSAEEISRVLEEIGPRCRGAFVNRVRHRGRWELLLELRNGPFRETLIFSIHPRACRLYLADRIPGSGEDATAFVRLLRARIEGLRIISVEQMESDRVMLLGFAGSGAEEAVYFLAVELTGKSANVLLLDPTHRKIGAMAGPGRSEEKMWVPPGKGKGHSRPARDFEDEAGQSYTDRMAAYYEKNLVQEENDERLFAMRRAAKKELARRSRLLGKLESDLRNAQDDLVARQSGELIKSHIARIPEGADLVLLPSFENPETEVKIALNPALSAGANADKYFERARRAQRTIKVVAGRIETVRQEKEKLGEFLSRLDSEDAIAGLEQQARQLGLLKASSAGESAEGGEGKKSAGETRIIRALESLGIRPRAFESPSGVPIYVGRNDKENDLLTTRFARPHDYFFHVSGAPGSHVLVCLEKSQPLDPATLRYAAHLALQYSALGKSGRGEVSCTEKRYVRKRRGDPPGAVHIVGPRKTVWVDLEHNSGRDK